MRILILGGTRYIGIHLTQALLEAGHDITLLTRGLRKDPFGSRVRRILCDRTDPAQLRAALRGEAFDVAYDSLAYASLDVRALLDVLQAGRYIMTSTVSVYGADRLTAETTEDRFDPLTYPLRWQGHTDDYQESKRQAEAALFQAYPGQPSVAVRFPLVMGADDYTGRLCAYVHHQMKGISMRPEGLTHAISFIASFEAGAFLAWLARSLLTGPVNAASDGVYSMRDALDYVRRETGCEARVAPDGAPMPFAGFPPYSLDCRKAKAKGFTFDAVKDWMPGALSACIRLVREGG